MDKAKKRRVKKYISWAALALAVALLAAAPLLSRKEAEPEGPVASILSGTVETGSVSSVIHGGGVLEEEDKAELSVPSGVLLTEYLVENGDRVQAGEPVAKVDRVSVMTAIAQVQDSLDSLAEQLEEAVNNDSSEEIYAPAGGRVKLIFARPGDDVQTVMLDHGALAVLSLDGMMAVDIAAPLHAGDRVDVTMADGSVAVGRVSTALYGRATVTVEDKDYAPGQTVSVALPDGTALGEGELYIHNSWNAVAYSGTVKTVHYAVDKTVPAGRVLITLDNVGSSAHIRTLSSKHREYEQVMLELFTLYQDLTVTAPCDGVISGVDEDGPLMLSSLIHRGRISLLANAPTGDDETLYTNFVGKVTGKEAGVWALALNPAPLPIADYKDLSAVPMDSELMTSVAAFVPTAPIYALAEGQWQQLAEEDIAVGDTLLFAADGSGSYVWVVRIAAADSSEEPDTPENPGGTDTPDIPDIPDIPIYPSFPSFPSFPSYAFGDGEMFGAAEGGEEQLYSLEGSVVAEITPQDIVTVTIAVDERVVSRVYCGQEAVVTLDALRGEEFHAAVTAVATQGSGNGGSSKFAVELSLQRAPAMLAGMNASVVIRLSVTEDGPIIPVAALTELDDGTVVYTGYDEENDVLTGPVAVTVGASDGQNACILAGLAPGDRYYYAYYDVLELDATAKGDRFTLIG